MTFLAKTCVLFEQIIIKKSSLERIEYDLAKARAAIREAVVTRSFKSEKSESFVPRGPMYRNAYAFHQ